MTQHYYNIPDSLFQESRRVFCRRRKRTLFLSRGAVEDGALGLGLTQEEAFRDSLGGT